MWAFRKRLVLGFLLLSATAALSPRAANGQVPSTEDLVPTAELTIGANDLIRVATSYADAIRERKTAQLSVNTLKSLRPNANITDLELRIADVNLSTAESKVRILRAMAEKLLAIAQADLEMLERVEQARRDFMSRTERSDKPTAETMATSRTNSRYAQVMFKIEILRMILDME